MKKRFRAWILLAVLIMTLSAGCSGQAASGNAAPTPAPGSAAEPDYSKLEDGADLTGGVDAGSGEKTGTALPVDPNRKLIRSGELEIESLAFEQSLSKLDLLLAKLGGYVETSSIVGTSKISFGQQLRSAELTVRVPSEQYDAFLKGSADLGNVLRQTTGAQDVTDSYYDTEARLTSQKMMEQRLLDLLSKSETLTDIVSLEQSLADTRYEIEKLTGTLRKWDALVEYSSFTLYIREVVQLTEEDPLKPEPRTLADRLKASFLSSIEDVKDGFSAFLVFLAGALPFLVIWGVILAAAVLLTLYLAKRSGRKRAASKNSAPVIQAEKQESGKPEDGKH